MRTIFVCSLLALAGTSQAANNLPLTVFAASSLTDAFTEMGKAFDAKMGTATTFQFAGSQVLRTQIENGAKADVFASADTLQFQPLVASGLMTNSGIFTKNRLVIIAPKTAARTVRTPGDLAASNVKLVVADKTVPAGQYTRAMLNAASKDGMYGPNFAARSLANVVSEEPNVRQVVLKVQLGEADAGVVYATDVTPRVAGTVVKINIPTRFNQLSQYPIGMMKSSPNAQLAQAFIAYVRSIEGQSILRKWGYFPVTTLR